MNLLKDDERLSDTMKAAQPPAHAKEILREVLCEFKSLPALAMTDLLGAAQTLSSITARATLCTVPSTCS